MKNKEVFPGLFSPHNLSSVGVSAINYLRSTTTFKIKLPSKEDKAESSTGNKFELTGESL